ncbi:MAG: hypothetical protein ACFFDN_01775 [Candidatus Hodarchaeota archaeon]
MDIGKKIKRLCGKYYHRSPKYIKSIIKKSIFTLTNRPHVDKSNIFSKNKSPIDYKGRFVISADFELGWAFRYSKTNPHPEKMAMQSRKNFPFLIKMFEKYNIPITWATVGHLFLKKCKKGDHDWMHRIPYFENKHWLFNKGDWFDCDPYTSWEKAKQWYAPDLIELILNSKVRHEIGCHSFSHIDLTYKNCPKEVAEDEIIACVESAKDWRINLKTFVFPGGTYGNLEKLKKYRFIAYRKSLKYELSNPIVDECGLVIIPVSRGLGDNGLGWSAEYFIKRYKKYIDKSIKTGTICHFWLHPSIDEWFLKGVFPDILRYAAEKREEGNLWIETMAEIVNLINNVSD